MDKESDKLIAALAAELTPVRPMRLKTGLGWLAAAVLATLAVTVLWFGLRADLMAGTAPPGRWTHCTSQRINAEL